MEKIRILIVEDKLLIAEDLASRLKKHDLEIVDICSTGEDAILKAKLLAPDLILMDIELAGAIDGISAAKIISQHQSIPIIYLSEYTDAKTVDRAKNTNPANYLSKPFMELDLIRAIDIAFTNAQQLSGNPGKDRTQIFIRTDTQVYVKLAIVDILFLEADRAYSTIVTTSKEYKLSTSMNHVYDQLNHDDFKKVHRSYIVNIKKIESINGNILRLGAREIQISKEHREELMRYINVIK